MSVPVNIIDIYHNYLSQARKLDQKNHEATRDDKQGYRASSAGFCARKLYYESVLRLEPSEPNKDSLAIFRLGSVVHEDVQEAIRLWARADGSGHEIWVEREIQVDEVSVRGKIDIMIIRPDGGIEIYDLKTANSFKWRKLFGRKDPDPTADQNYALQLGTYGIWAMEYVGNDTDSDMFLAKLALLYYNKDKSTMREVLYDDDIVDNARVYWHKLALSHQEGLPPINIGTAPVQRWECNPKYCGYYDECGGGVNV